MPIGKVAEFPFQNSSDGSSVSVSTDQIVILADRGGVAIGSGRLFSAFVRPPRANAQDFSSQSRSVDIPLVGEDGVVTGVLCHEVPSAAAANCVARFDGRDLETVSEITRVAVHDINNLLAVIDSGLRLLSRQDDEEGRGAILGKMREAIGRGALLSRRILDSMQPRTMSVGVSAASLRVAGLVETLRTKLRSTVEVRAAIDPELWKFRADPDGLYLTLLGLCENAADSMPEGGKIVLSAQNVHEDADTARRLVSFSILDNGAGMSEQAVALAFGPRTSTNTSEKSRGVSLAQVQHFVQRQGGAVTIRSEPAIGTLVRLVFPSVVSPSMSSALGGCPNRSGGLSRIAYTPSATGDGGFFHLTDVEGSAEDT
ncbi:signal transduction histidine kinase [Nitrobacteraceae bacterium AZCC 1564]